jgi:hypothetical protein
MDDRDLTLREALASDRLEDFVRQQEARGVELANGSELERALALLITQRAWLHTTPLCCGIHELSIRLLNILSASSRNG